MNLQLIKQESFNNILMDVYRNDNNEVFMTAEQLGSALEYSTKAQAITNIVNRNEYLKGEEFSVQLKLSSTDGKQYDTRIFTEDGIYEVTMLSKQPKAQEFRHFVRQLLKGLRKGEIAVAQPVTKLQDELEAVLIGVKFIADDLRVANSSRLGMYHKAHEQLGLPTSQLPQYVDEEVTRSATDLLKQHSKPMSAIKFNNKMIALGLLELKERPSSNGGTKEFKSLTDGGLRYGKNLVSQHNTKETQPHYYESKFAELLTMLNK